MDYNQVAVQEMRSLDLTGMHRYGDCVIGWEENKMKIFRVTLMLLICLAFIAMLSGCSFYGADEGVIRGVVYYSDDKTIVANPWVAVYETSTPDVEFLLVQGDEMGRYSAFVPEGIYIALGSTAKLGPFSGVTTGFSVLETVTTVKRITITEVAP